MESDLDVVQAFVSAKLAQGHSAMAELEGVSVISSGERGSSISISHDGGEMVIIGQLPHAHLRSTGSPRNPVRRDSPNDQKPIEKREIDLTDEQVTGVLNAWRDGRSALELEFIDAVFKGGRWHSKP